VSPRDLCLQYAQGIRVAPSAFDPRDYNAVILANGVAARQYPGLSDLPLQSVRGQISLLQTSDDVSDDFHVRTNLCYGGYLSARQPGGGYVAGATFQQWRDDVTVCDEDHVAILSQLEQAIPATQGRFSVTGGRAALRCAARDRFPVIGAVPDSSSLYISTAHGSHGLISSLAGAEYLADLICGTVTSLSAATAGALAPGRFAAREAARARKRDGQKAKFQ
jgi:tRNA 5-methylaminomethyl-2-thiouridine biosynthesis bifunctional protein